MKINRWWPAIGLVFILGNFRAVHADTEIDGTATSSTSFTLSGVVSISTLTATSITVSTLTINNQIVAALKNSSITLQGITVDSITVNNQQSGIVLGALQQIVMSSVTASVSTTNNSFTNTNLSVSITPKFANDKIKLTACGPLYNSGVNNMFVFLTFAKGSTNLMGSNGGAKCDTEFGGDLICQACLTFVDTVSDTSPITYNLQYKKSGGGASSAVFCQDGSVTCVMIAEEYKL